jgi:hypothetical protein
MTVSQNHEMVFFYILFLNKVVPIPHDLSLLARFFLLKTAFYKNCPLDGPNQEVLPLLKLLPTKKR